jgi:maintenance of morphology protein 1
MQIKIDFKYDDQITLAIETMALVNWPRPVMASLPISLSFSLVKFSGTIVIQFESKTDSQSSSSEVTDSFFAVLVMPDFILDFSVGSLLGHRTKVKDLPKLTLLISTTLRNIFIREFVAPSKKLFKLPKLYEQ